MSNPIEVTTASTLCQYCRDANVVQGDDCCFECGDWRDYYNELSEREKRDEELVMRAYHKAGLGAL